MKIQLQIAAAGGVEQNAIGAAFNADALDMRQRGLLGVLDILQQRARGGDGGRQMVAAIALQIEHMELLQYLLPGAVRVKMPGRAAAQAAALL